MFFILLKTDIVIPLDELKQKKLLIAGNISACLAVIMIQFSHIQN